MPRIPEHQIRDIRDRTDIVDLIASYGLSPTRKGRNFVCLCPFHEDHNPSLQIDPTRQWFRCWVDGARGDVIDFVMQYEKVEFAEAVETLARRLGIEIIYEGASAEDVRQAKARGEWKNQLYDINAEAMRFYKRRLNSDAGRIARDYLLERNITPESLDLFDVGWAPGDGDALFTYLSGKKISPKAMLAAGLIRESYGRLRDYFTAQITFPFKDITERVLGFSARKLPGDERPIGKYINTPNTPVFSKSRAVYGLDQVHKHANKERNIVLCEGQLDVIMCHQFDFRNVVALSGTAAPVDGLRIIRRHADTVIVLTDGDAPGQAAAERIVPLFLELNIAGKIAVMPEGADPADMLSNGRENQLEKIIRAAKDGFDFVLDRWVETRNLSNPAHVSEIGNEMMKIASATSDPILRTALRRQVAQRLFINENELSFSKHRPLAEPIQPPTAPDTFSDPISIRDKAERDVLRAIIRHPELIDRAYEYTDLDFNALTGPGHRELAMAILEADATTDRPAGDPITLNDILLQAGESSPLRRLVLELAEDSPSLDPGALDIFDEFDMRARRVCALMIEDRLALLYRELAQARETGDDKQVLDYERQIVALGQKRRRHQSPDFKKRAGHRRAR